MEFDLVGFVMGALESEEHAQIEQALEDDEELQQQLDLIRKALRPLESYRYCEPPAGLADATQNYVFEQIDLHKVAPASFRSFSPLASAERTAGKRTSWRLSLIHI